ncbi:MAG: DUF4982 domain-containing protein [Bacteroidales bacterium]|nr:DUF4982 domain-containing protein [Bacteroidales bacterium]
MGKIINALLAVVIVIAAAFSGISCASQGSESPRSETLLDKGWKFHRGEAAEGQENALIEEGGVPEAALAGYDDSGWQDVTVPHDWAIYGPFDEENDIQIVAVHQNGETVATRKTGRTGGLPYEGVGWYRRSFEVPAGKRAELVFDGAMSRARVWVNGVEACYWPYGYNSFHCDVTDLVQEGENLLAVRLENLPNSSRWYPGAGLYRDVHLVLTDEVHVPVWGTQVVADILGNGETVVRVKTTVDGAVGRDVELLTEIVNAEGVVVAERRDPVAGTNDAGDECVVAQSIGVDAPQLWSPERPYLYTAVSKIYEGDNLLDEYTTRFGFRTIRFDKEKGFILNGEVRKFQGVCNHHDLGPLGAAVNEAALRHQLLMLKDMGCDAIRTSHNMPAPQLVELCDELGLMMMVESFDEWDIPKCENGYHLYFDEWAEKDMENMIRHYRNDPAVIIWSIGNEVPSQCAPDGSKTAEFLRDICHREDPTRPITCGMDQAVCVLKNGFANVIDIPGLNYRTFKYIEAHNILPQGLVLGSETASAVSSRGYYDIPAIKRYGAVDESHQCSSYDLEACSWANIPDVDFALQEDYDWTIGQFVWTGFDYLGEPSPYDTEAWPNHSSMFGIIDLASLPKDRFYLYRSVWNRTEPTLHILPHWNWTEGANIPVFVYTSWPEAELFVNGVSQGRQSKYRSGVNGMESPVGIDPVNKSMYEKDIVKAEPGLSGGGINEPVETRYRLMWYDVPYEPGELKVVAYDDEGNAVGEEVVRTAGEPDHIELVCSYGVPRLKADGKDLAYVTVKIVDKDGNLCPYEDSLVKFDVTGAASFRAAANGDPTCLDLFHEPQMHAFNGMLTVIVQSGEKRGNATLSVSADGLPTATMKFSCI